MRRPAKGEPLDLRKYELPPGKPGYREMIKVALRRIARRRKIDILLPD